MDRAQIELQVVIPATPEKLFGFLTVPGKVRLVLPGLIDSTNVSEMPLQVGSTFDYKYQMYGVIFDGQWEVLVLESPTRYEARTTGGAASTWKYKLEEIEGGTRLWLTVEYEVPQTFLGKVKTELVKTVNESEANHFLENLKAVFDLQGGGLHT